MATSAHSKIDHAKVHVLLHVLPAVFILSMRVTQYEKQRDEDEAVDAKQDDGLLEDALSVLNLHLLVLALNLKFCANDIVTGLDTDVVSVVQIVVSGARLLAAGPLNSVLL